MFFFSRAIKIDIWLVLLLSVSMFFVGPPVLSANSHSGQVKIGVLAKRGTQKAMEKWGPTAQYLTKTIQNSNFRTCAIVRYKDICQYCQEKTCDSCHTKVDRITIVDSQGLPVQKQ